MYRTPSRPPDEERVGVTLNPALAKEVARALRIQLACELDRPFDEALPSREDAAHLRSVLDVCVDQLDMLAWGEASGDVRMAAPGVCSRRSLKISSTAAGSESPTPSAGTRPKPSAFDDRGAA